MNKSVSILDKEYKEWVKDLALRYRNSQIKAAVKVNTEMLKFYWELGKDIVELHAEKRWGDSFHRFARSHARRIRTDTTQYLLL